MSTLFVELYHRKAWKFEKKGTKMISKYWQMKSSIVTSPGNENMGLGEMLVSLFEKWAVI